MHHSVCVCAEGEGEYYNLITLLGIQCARGGYDGYLFSMHASSEAEDKNGTREVYCEMWMKKVWCT